VDAIVVGLLRTEKYDLELLRGSINLIKQLKNKILDYFWIFGA
jgi:hypothetical protein